MMSTEVMLPACRAITPVNWCRIPGPGSASTRMPIFSLILKFYRLKFYKPDSFHSIHSILEPMRLWTALLPLFVALPLLAQETILLPVNTKIDPSAPAEKIEERGKGGVVDRSIANVSQPTVTVYLPAKEKANGTGI